MAEDSYLWTTGGAGDGSATFTRADWSEILRILGACLDDEGVAPAYLNALAPSTTGANNCRIATGGALVDGKPYSNSANVDVTIASAVGGGNTRIDRVVLRADWTAQTVRITRIAGTDAASPTAPAITQTPGTTYDIKLCQCLVNTAGTVTITDERVFAKPGTDTITTAAITDAAVTAAKIANRTRSFLVTPAGAQRLDTGAEIFADSVEGIYMPDGQESDTVGYFYCPDDYASGLTVKAILTPASSGNIRISGEAYYGAAGESTSAHSASFAEANVAVTVSQNNAIASMSLSSIAQGDYVAIRYVRQGDEAGDTIGNTVYFRGFLVSYTADS